MCKFVGCQSATGKNHFGIPQREGGKGCTGKSGSDQDRGGEWEAAKARRAKEVRWVQKRIKVDKARRTAATAATAFKNEEEEEAVRRMTADKRWCDAM
jgi:hypothetical protein